jgi:hypothetical protein
MVRSGKFKFVSAVPDLPKERLQAFCSDLEKISSTSEADATKFKQQTIKTSFAFSNDIGMNDSVKVLGKIPAKKFPPDKLRVALIVGQGNFESMTPELLNHAHMVLFVDIDKNVLQHNLFMAKLLQGNEDFQQCYLDETQNPLLLNRVKQGSLTAYHPRTGEQIAHYDSTEYTPEYLAATLFNKGCITFARFSVLASKLRMYIKGEKKSPQGGPLFDKSDLKEFSELKNVMLTDTDYAQLIPEYEKLCKGIDTLVNNKKNKSKVFAVQEAEKLKAIIDAVVDNHYFVSKDLRFDGCRAASQELRFTTIQMNLFNQAQASQLKAVFDANNVVVTFANVTNLYYYDNEHAFRPTARAEQPWSPKRNLVNSLKLLCDLKDTIYFFSTYEKAGSQLLSSQCYEGLINYVGAMTRNLKMLNTSMVGTKTMAKLRDQQR